MQAVARLELAAAAARSGRPSSLRLARRSPRCTAPRGLVVQPRAQAQATQAAVAHTLQGFDFEGYVKEKSEMVERALDKSTPAGYPERIWGAMRYSLLGGGKRIRPMLTLAACELVGGSAESAMPTACALEMIHTMSLIHDDLPNMDNDDYRRGKLTNHKVYGEDVAILAGDAMLARAFEHIARETRGVAADRVLRVLADVAAASGAGGLVGGQVVDLECEGRFGAGEPAGRVTLEWIHAHKTAALLEAAVVSGAVLGGASEAQIGPLRTYAQSIGLAFQVIDDILDVTATSEVLGKTAGKDLAAEKTTYPKLLGLEASRKIAADLIATAKAALGQFEPGRAAPLLALADYIASRKN